jgi:hypothetical protein
MDAVIGLRRNVAVAQEIVFASCRHGRALSLRCLELDKSRRWGLFLVSVRVYRRPHGSRCAVLPRS